MSKPVSFDLSPDVAAVTLISPKTSSRISSLSPRQEDRLEAQGKYPRSVRLGIGPNSRKARVLGEVLDWNRARIAERDGSTT